MWFTEGSDGILQRQSYTHKFIAKNKIGNSCKAEQVEDVIAIIIENSKTGKVGDGKIFIQDISGAVRIRTGEKDRDAL